MGMDRNDRLVLVAAWLVLAAFAVIAVAGHVTGRLPGGLVDCATAWLAVGTPVIAWTTWRAV
jgi:hypothetical protein